MAMRTESKYFAVTCNRLLQIIYPSQLLKPRVHGSTEVIERRRAIGMAMRAENKCFPVTCNRLLQILHPSCLLKASAHGTSEVIERRRAIGRSEERHGGKEGRARKAPYHYKKHA